MCQNSIIDQIDNAHSLGKHKKMKEQCTFYLDNLGGQNVLLELYQQANQFATDAYSELQKDDLFIALSNTSTIPRNIDAFSNLKINLEAINKMLDEVIAKESKTIAQDIKDEIVTN